MNIQIIPAEINDLEAILDLQKTCYLSEAELYNDFSIAPMTQDLASIQNDFQTQILLKAELDGKLAGSVRAFQKNESVYVGRLIVHPEVQNQGIGRKLLHAIEVEFPGCKRFELFTGFRSEKNLYLYQKQGYHEFRQEKINENLTIVFLEKVNCQ